MTNRTLLGNYSGEGVLKEGKGGGDDVGELREEEIVWGEAEILHHHRREADAAMAGGLEEPEANIIGVRKHLTRISMLTRQMDMAEAGAWAAGDQMSTTIATKKRSGKGNEHEKMGSGRIEKQCVAAQRRMDELIPPHELLARQYAASSASFSVLHGAGRTLKGMDLRRLRNEVWRQTGFVD